ncbi:hypothetical protein E1A91_D04G007300v1 [Gossypium mustelinum]|uniref:C2H2-type domain-containing protein n=1 Tax=Gossypium mustelinum TaxID=34275 RepID=A0A5D2V8D2_GOSMU|nr:hypothetical protein E1A91_D04G007300v1 [Gossypium mustelinum]
MDVVAMGSRHNTNVVKGKRTKRSRPQSPIPFVILCNNGGEVLDGIGNSSSSSSFEYQDSTTEEEEDMANCLILLAQGKSRESPKDMLVYKKFASRKFLETPSNGTGKVGYYVYECKKMASHKKPKATLSEVAMVEAAYEEQGPNYNNNNNSKVKVKVHECSICGAEFTSGQALGGHMRRHRGSIGNQVNVLTTNTTLSLTVPMALESEKPKKPPNVLSLSLDLNLPAPEDDHRESEFTFASNQQQQQQPPLVFSASTLVDCHY